MYSYLVCQSVWMSVLWMDGWLELTCARALERQTIVAHAKKNCGCDAHR